ncbi:hypothetical protein VTL71DRAFT_7111 [Oculimacula yallundae]|uniref:Uncharacterized protein n=1 Tax=Oculimacula yallundae TaxID=86028 RepID=A0ABR4BYD4_9HELO
MYFLYFYARRRNAHISPKWVSRTQSYNECPKVTHSLQFQRDRVAIPSRTPHDLINRPTLRNSKMQFFSQSD